MVEVIKKIASKFKVNSDQVALDNSTASIRLNYPQCFYEQYPQLFPIANEASDEVIRLLAGVDYSPLAKHSPGLQDFCWKTYLECAKIRMVKVLNFLTKYLPHGSTVLDYGSYFGNFSLMTAKAGYQTIAVDDYQKYQGVFTKNIDLLQNNGVDVIDFSQVNHSLDIIDDQFDCILCLGVIEHIPHTPRYLMETLKKKIKKNGLLILETPNLAYIYNRQKLFKGHSIFLPIEYQYYTGLPFAGHHREYTLQELSWILQKNQFKIIDQEAFNQSIYMLGELKGLDLHNYLEMQNDQLSREMFLIVAQNN